jgi:hypothetical protein
MTDTITKALEPVYTALNADNEGLEPAIGGLKIALDAAGTKAVTMEKDKLVHNNRQGRKLLQSYFRKRGIEVSFNE